MLRGVQNALTKSQLSSVTIRAVVRTDTITSLPGGRSTTKEAALDPSAKAETETEHSPKGRRGTALWIAGQPRPGPPVRRTKWQDATPHQDTTTAEPSSHWVAGKARPKVSVQDAVITKPATHWVAGETRPEGTDPKLRPMRLLHSSRTVRPPLGHVGSTIWPAEGLGQPKGSSNGLAEDMARKDQNGKLSLLRPGIWVAGMGIKPGRGLPPDRFKGDVDRSVDLPHAYPRSSGVAGRILANAGMLERVSNRERQGRVGAGNPGEEAPSAQESYRQMREARQSASGELRQRNSAGMQPLREGGLAHEGRPQRRASARASSPRGIGGRSAADENVAVGNKPLWDADKDAPMPYHELQFRKEVVQNPMYARRDYMDAQGAHLRFWAAENDPELNLEKLRSIPTFWEELEDMRSPELKELRWAEARRIHEERAATLCHAAGLAEQNGAQAIWLRAAQPPPKMPETEEAWAEIRVEVDTLIEQHEDLMRTQALERGGSGLPHAMAEEAALEHTVRGLPVKHEGYEHVMQQLALLKINANWPFQTKRVFLESLVRRMKTL